MAVVEKHTLDGANTFTLMKHKHKGHTHEWRHHDCYDVVLWLLLSRPIYKVHVGVAGGEVRIAFSRLFPFGPRLSLRTYAN